MVYTSDTPYERDAPALQFRKAILLLPASVPLSIPNVSPSFGAVIVPVPSIPIQTSTDPKGNTQVTVTVWFRIGLPVLPFNNRSLMDCAFAARAIEQKIVPT